MKFLKLRAAHKPDCKCRKCRKLRKEEVKPVEENVEETAKKSKVDQAFDDLR